MIPNPKLMIKYLAVRVRSYDDIKDFFQQHGLNVVQAGVARVEQVLSNLTEGLYDKGMERTVDGHELRWFLVSGDVAKDIEERWSMCELGIEKDWFDQFKSSIRHYTGVKYWDATYGLAGEWELKPQERNLRYSLDEFCGDTARADGVVAVSASIAIASPATAVEKQSGNASRHEVQPTLTHRSNGETDPVAQVKPRAVQRALPVAKKSIRRPRKRAVITEDQLDFFG